MTSPIHNNIVPIISSYGHRSMTGLMQLWAERIYETKINNKSEDQIAMKINIDSWHKEITNLNGQRCGKIFHVSV